MLHSRVTAGISQNPLSGRKITRILVIYTGGTIGMKHVEDKGYMVVPKYFPTALKKLPMLYDEEYVKERENDEDKEIINESEEFQLPYHKYPELVMPLSKDGTRIFYYIKEHHTILDSADISMANWMYIAEEIKSHYTFFDSFIVLHGTDTMAYTASALSYMLTNLGKTVILTGSQIPIFEQRNDGRSNFLGALQIAGHYIIPEVTLFFSNKLFRGNRSQKTSTSELDAFSSPNLPPLATCGLQISVAWDAVFSCHSLKYFDVDSTHQMCENVGLLRLFPGINAKLVKSFLQPPMQGVVIESFGAGNVPANRPDLIEEFRKAAEERHVLIINITQCLKGAVSDAYAAGKVMYDIGCIPGYDMTPEAALTKLAYVLGKKGMTHAGRKAMLSSNLRGEVTLPQQEQRYSMQDSDFVHTVAQSLRIGSQTGMNSVRRALHPILLTCAAKAGDKKTIQQLIDQKANLNEPSDYDGKTSLHLACAEGHLDVVHQLLINGSSIYVRDRRGRIPLFDAIRNKQSDVVQALLSVGSQFEHDDIEVTRELCVAAKDDDVEKLRLFHLAMTDMNQIDLDGRTALHVAVLKHNVETVKFLVEEVGVSVEKPDMYGKSALEIARELHLYDIIRVMDARPPQSPLRNKNLIARSMSLNVETPQRPDY